MQPRPEQRHVVDRRDVGEPRPDREAVVRPDLDEGTRVRGEDLVSRPDGGEAPAVEEADPRRVLGLVHVGRRDEDRQPFGVKLVQKQPELAPRDGVDAGRRLVEKEEVGARQEGGDERELLFHPAGERAREPVADAREPDARKERGRAPLRLGVRDRVHPGPEEEVLVYGEVFVEREALRHHAEGAPLLDAEGSARRREEPRDDPEEGRLSRAVGADQGEEFAPLDDEIDAIERRHGAEAPRESLRRDHFAGAAA